MNVVQAFGGIDNLIRYYPSIELPLAHEAYFETIWIVISHAPLTRPKVASREAVEMLCRTTYLKRRFYIPCPIALLLNLWDIGSLAAAFLQSPDGITIEDAYSREQLLLNLLSFQPEKHLEFTQGMNDGKPSAVVMANIWKSAVIILALRYLFFGKPSLAPIPYLQEPSASSYSSHGSVAYTSQGDPTPYYTSTRTAKDDPLETHLSTGLYLDDPLSRSPSPLPSLAPESDLWDNRYELHDEAYTQLYAALNHPDVRNQPRLLRFLFLPILIFAFVSRKDSPERELCFSLFTQLKDYMAANHPPGGMPNAPSPQCGALLNFDLPWAKLDAFSEASGAMLSGNPSFSEGGLTKGVCEWNWYDMVKELQIDHTLVCKCPSFFSSLDPFCALSVVCGGLFLTSPFGGQEHGGSAHDQYCTRLSLPLFMPLRKLQQPLIPRHYTSCLCFVRDVYAHLQAYELSHNIDPISNSRILMVVHATRFTKQTTNSDYSPFITSHYDNNLLMLTNLFLGPINSGTGFVERGSEWTAFSIISSIVNDETFAHLLQPPPGARTH